MAYQITRDLLLSTRYVGSRRLEQATQQLIAGLGFVKRGCRAGLHVRSRHCVYKQTVYRQSLSELKPIPVIVGFRPPRRLLPDHGESKLVRINTQPVTQLNIGLLNAQSIGNKAAAINDCIVSNCFDVMTIVESWHDSFQTPSIIAATPTNYRVIERARVRRDDDKPSLQSNHGGICVFVRCNIKIKQVDFPLYRTFELLPLFIQDPAITSLVLVIYRPGSAPSTVEFIDEFADVLERSSSYANCIIVGDINLHIDDQSAPHTGLFHDLYRTTLG